ncbi:50S ribosomal protein L6 [Candidatus Symbiobacter mobilis]|uniref:Large ribosomal subunit protein uL6 n=1 Tax=Candidatus Symbiobacter mobilis CR TaxID=946483 RepID=U5N4E9_9BURK|nr:50S ribosomal protein L6 [Candidatus Symbiobacter mobilis]AGX86331.1 ribosomal protein L6 [Candidatus Symbiobacter mobilis CR]
MSRVGKLPVRIPTGVEVTLTSETITVRGPLGVLSQTLHPDVLVSLVNKGESQVAGEAEFQHICCKHNPPKGAMATNTAMVGTLRQLIQNMATGVHVGFEKKLQLVGTGYKAQAQGTKLTLTVGYSHPVEMDMPAGISVATPTPTDIIVKGSNRQVVGQIAAEIRLVRPPEPYKGKGIRYANEQIVIKEVKKK